MPPLVGRFNFSDMKKLAIFRKVEKNTAKSLKEDPIALERLIRQNREAEINHFVSMVRQKIEYEGDRFANMELDFIDKDWLTSKGTFKTKLDSSVTHTEKVRELALLDEGKPIYGTIPQLRTEGQRFRLAKAPSILTLPKTAGNLSQLREVSKDEIKVESNQEGRVKAAIEIQAPPVVRYLNFDPYDGQKEIAKMEDQYSRILDKLKSPKLVMKLPEGTLIPNRHLTDYYFVKKMPMELTRMEFTLPSGEGDQEIDKLHESLSEVIEQCETIPIEDATQGEEEGMEEDSQDNEDSKRGKGGKKKWIKKSQKQTTNGAGSKHSSSKRLIFQVPSETLYTGGMSMREVINLKQSSLQNISSPSFTKIDSMIDSPMKRKEAPPVVLPDLVQQLLVAAYN